MVSALARKVLRDLGRLRSQAIAIALVVASGVATLVMSQSTWRSLELTRARFYADYAFADMWAAVKRAPETLAARLAAIDGVQAVETRLVAPATLRVPGFADPVRAVVQSLPVAGAPVLDRLYLRRGRLPAPNARDEAVLSDAFADAHRYRPGDRIQAIVHGRSQWFRVVGVASSPEYVYQIRPGSAFPDFKRFAILWTSRRGLEAALDMDGAFNTVALRLRPGVPAAAVAQRVDALLARYGGIGAYARDEQLSHRYLESELRQLAVMALLFPAIFLGVSAFLLNVVLTRLVGAQRGQVAVLKAVGYTDVDVARHYLGIVALIAAGGALLGVAGGAWLGHWMAGVYRDFFRFPFLDYRVGADVVASGLGVSLGATLAGTLQAVFGAMRLPPAEAMRPPAPERYRALLAERLGLQRWFAPTTRMILRQLERHPFKALLTVAGLALGCSIMMVGRFQNDAIDYLTQVEFYVGQHYDIAVDFTEPTARAALFELGALPGVTAVEPYRAVGVRLRHRARSYRTAIEGLPANGRLRTPMDVALRPVALPPDGLLLDAYLARMLGVRVGDVVDVDVLEGRRRTLLLRVAGTVDEYLGARAYMRLDTLDRALGDGALVSGAWLGAEPARQGAVMDALERRPRVAGMGERMASLRSFLDTMAESILVFTLVTLLLGGLINFGVVYNTARIALSERSRELATMRVLGFTEREVGAVLLGELGLLVLAAVPLGFAAGALLCWGMATAMQSDLMRIPVHFTSGTYAIAALATLAAAALSAAAVYRRVARLDLLAVLKAQE
ncbi:MAG TPA: ABC transporter permease [Mizugakiibacter sp.]